MKEPRSLWELREKFLDHLKARGYSSQTRTLYGTNLRAFLNWAEGQGVTGILDLGSQQLREYTVHLALRDSKHPRADGSKGLTLSTRSHHVSAIKSFFKYLRKAGYLLMDPALELEPPRVRKKLPKDILTVDEIMRVLAIIDDSQPRGMRDRAALELLYATALRRAEIVNLRLGDLNFNQRLIQFAGKGNKERILPLAEQASHCLQRYLLHGRPKLGKRHKDYVFVSPRCGPIRSKELTESLRRYAKAAGVAKKVTLHTIRHTCATHMLLGQADIRHIQLLLGHESLKTTQVYTHLDTRDLADVLRRCHPREQGFS